MNSVDEVLARLRALRANDVPTHGGRTLSYVYDSGLADADTLGRHALADFGGTNGLDPTAFPSLLAMENDLVAFAGDLLDAESGCAGTVTSGGTESILLAVKAARDASAVVSPAMVLPATAHAAFHKAAHYFGVRPVVVDVDPVTFRADPDAMRAAVDDSTVLLVGSAPSYAHGVIDPIAAIAAIGADRGIRVHVDACIGGWVLPFLPDVAPWTFAVPGVTSISVDLHKYGYSPKGVSILLHRNAELRRSQFFATADWPGYTMLNTTIQSTKSGGPLAAAWAVAAFLGREGYADLARTARQASLDVAAGVTGLRPLVAPDSTLLALVASDDFDVYTVADEMAARGWLVQPQLPYRGGPASLHLSLCAATAPLVPELLGALADSVAVARAAGPVALDPGLVAVVAALDPSGLDAAAFDGILAMAGMSGGAQLPERMAMINALLGEASSQLREALLLAFLDRLTRPERLS
ncbi:MAG: aminotransferase class V-fold PLP-dependent enzyme [Dermatophilaceae bacterium]